VIRYRYRICFIWLIVLAGWVHPGMAHSDEPVPSGYRQVAGEQGIPDELLYAIALTESGRQMTTRRRPWPWTLNIKGHGYYYASRLTAWLALRERLEQGIRSIDIGLMQVNWRYHQKQLGDPWQALDPYHNLRVGAAILRACYAHHRDWWSSVGCYHAPTNPVRAERYRNQVQAQWRTLKAGA